MSATRSGAAAQRLRRRRLLESRAPEIVFLGLLALGFVTVIVDTRGFSFNGDEWDYVVARQGMSAATLLRPHGPHLTVLPILIYKLLLALFGGGSYLPFRVMAAVDLVIVALALGVACRDRWGRWWGLAPVLLLVTLGPGAVTILWPFQVGYAIAVAAGFAALVALDRQRPYGDVIGCVALLVSLASGSQGIGFVVGAAVMIILQGSWRRRAWIVLVPAILYLLWYAAYGRQASETHLGLWGSALSYSFQALSATFEGIVGLSSVAPTTGPLDITYGVPIALAAVAAVAVGAWRGWRARPVFWGSAATLVVILVAASLSNYGAFLRPPTDPRYLSSDVALLLVCVCAALPRPRLERGGIVVAAIVLAVVALTNLRQYGEQRAVYLAADQTERAELGALEIARGAVNPSYSPGVVDAQLVNIKASAFFSAADSFGLREDTPAALLRQSPVVRVDADAVLRGAELSFSRTASSASGPGTPPTVLSGSARVVGRCLVLGAQSVYLRVSAGRFTVTAPTTGSLAVSDNRFAPNYVTLLTVSNGDSALTTFPADRAPDIPWRVMLTGAGGQVCAAGQ